MSPRRLNPRHGARAFTLLEVMMATIIIGLGVLGLTALFAGAAKQQIDTARLGDAVKISQSIERQLRGRVGTVSTGFAGPPGATQPTGLTNIRVGQYEMTNAGRGLDVPLVETVWYPLSAYPARVNQPRWPAHTLALDQANNLSLEDPLSLFFVVDGPEEVVLYENRLDGVASPPRPTYTGGVALMAPPAGFRVVDYIRGAAGQNAAAFTAGSTGRDIVRLPHGRISPGSLRIRFEIARQMYDATQSQFRGVVASRRTVYFDDAPYSSEADDDNLPGPVQTFPGTHPLAQVNGVEGLVSSDGLAFLQLNRFLDPPDNPTIPLAPTSGVIERFVLPLAGDEWVERIVVERYAYRNDRLLTLDERVQTSADGKYATGAAILLQRARDGQRRVGVLAYGAEPLGGPFLAGRQPRFIPPESGDGNPDERLLHRVELRLEFEPATGQVFVTPQSPPTPPAFALERGDIILIMGNPTDEGSIGTSNGFPGADGFVRVVRNEIRTQPSTEYRSYLDGVPRSAGRPMVSGDTGPLAAPISKNVEAWTLRGIVESLEDYVPRPNANSVRVKWKITPLEGRVLGGE